MKQAWMKVGVGVGIFDGRKGGGEQEFRGGMIVPNDSCRSGCTIAGVVGGWEQDGTRFGCGAYQEPVSL
ncbi:MAG: hypothetical protein DIAAKJNI_00056 [Candidatus Argoarchaeum ethanivorans]|uniref:Uncharacterized protein n=1 Tax=Candidatus Argoarchaeum ethanivorans TaxID=2608793 RepID=A0A811T1Y0_9EURY|nr:MAG: hypothetical protein DIAAKJNI_00056 [Candidatus Argoarchaeum ethanivorans]